MVTKIEVIFNHGGEVPPGVNLKSIEEDIAAELARFVEAAGEGEVSVSKKRPSGKQQGVELAIEWLIELAKEPGAIVVYAKTLLYALNKISRKLQKQNSEPKKEDVENSAEQNEKKEISLKLLGKEIALPASTAVIKQFIESLSGE